MAGYPPMARKRRRKRHHRRTVVCGATAGSKRQGCGAEFVYDSKAMGRGRPPKFCNRCRLKQQFTRKGKDE